MSSVRIAYMSTLYPGLTHTFIEREVAGLRKLGVDVQTFATRVPAPEHVIGTENAEAARTTTFLLESVPALIAAQVWALTTRPIKFIRALVAAQSSSPPGISARLLHLVYFAEAAYFCRVLRRRGLRHVHIHFANHGVTIARLACVLSPDLSYSVSVHGARDFQDIVGEQVGEKVRGARFVRCISRFCRAQVMTLMPHESWDRLLIARCGIDPNRFPPKQRRRTADEPLALVAVGRLAPVKGFHVLFHACRLLSDRGVSWRLDLVGDGPLRDELEQSAAALGIRDRVVFSGAVTQDDLPKHLEAADVMVLSSFLEGLPVVLMEAMAKELPVVSTRVTGIPELVEHRVTGMLVDPSAPGQIADALAELAANPELAQALAKAGRQKVVAEFDVEETARTLLRAFESVS